MRQKFRTARMAAAAFGGLFTVVAGVLLVLVLTLPVARSERIGYAFACAAAACALWTVWWFVQSAMQDDEWRNTRR